MNRFLNNIKFAILLTTVVNSSGIFAANIAADIKGTDESEDGGYLEVEFGGGIHKSVVTGELEEGIGVGLNTRYQWNRLFFEVESQSFGTDSGAAFGYRAWSSDNWTVDLIALLNDGLVPEDVDRFRGSKLKLQNSRLSYGFRASGSVGDYLIQAHILPGTTKGYTDYPLGHAATLAFGRQWNWQNWNLYALAGIGYQPSQKVRYSTYDDDDDWVSVTEESGGSLSWGARVGALYPINEHWVFKAFVSHTSYGESARISPLIQESETSRLFFSVGYVF